ncbi:MAG: diguanylate cyclase [Gammaproteobacteria bacterium]|nr:diguanylate cyclase [Gammaproteobacteria bacterium]
MKSSTITFSNEIKDLVIDSLSLTHDGIGVFDAKDTLLYCNEVMAEMFSLPASAAIGMPFDSLIKHNYQTKTGLVIETDSLSQWLSQAHKLRRSQKFRRFEVDFHGDRWFLVTEHTSADKTILMFCSEITEQKIYQAQLEELNNCLVKLAYRDPLTNLLNRRSFYESAENELSRCNRQSLKISLLMIDLDKFKSVNDRFGHEGGDKVLIETSTIMLDLLRQYDLLGRLGGEEFVILLPNTDISEAVVIGNRILQKLRKASFPAPMKDLQVTASIGASEYARSLHSSLDDLIRDADQKLYQAKSSGRDMLIS